MFTTAVFFLLFCCHVSGTNYCSDTVHPARCSPCPDFPNKHHQCPQQCGRQRDLKLCDRVCSSNCLDSECRYDNTGVLLICTKGCVETYTGLYCQKRCPKGCRKCSQDGARCLACEHGWYGKNCSQECRSCNGMDCDANGVCKEGCMSGMYGERCQKSCGHCDECDRHIGNCLAECHYGFFGSFCLGKCPSKCTMCARTGECLQCQNGYQLKEGYCQEIRSSTTSSEVTDAVGDKAARTDTNHAEIFQAREVITTEDDTKNQGFILPAIIILLVFCAGVVVFGICRYIRSRNRQRRQVIFKSSALCRDDVIVTAPLYEEIAQQIKKASLENTPLANPDRPILPPPPPTSGHLNLPDKHLCQYLSMNMNYMTPVGEDNLTRSSGSLQFVPEVELRQCAEPTAPVWTGSLRSENGHQNFVFENERVGCSGTSNESMPFQDKTSSSKNRHKIPSEYMDLSYSGRSTPISHVQSHEDITDLGQKRDT